MAESKPESRRGGALASCWRTNLRASSAVGRAVGSSGCRSGLPATEGKDNAVRINDDGTNELKESEIGRVIIPFRVDPNYSEAESDLQTHSWGFTGIPTRRPVPQETQIKTPKRQESRDQIFLDPATTFCPRGIRNPVTAVHGRTFEAASQRPIPCPTSFPPANPTPP